MDRCVPAWLGTTLVLSTSPHPARGIVPTRSGSHSDARDLGGEGGQRHLQAITHTGGVGGIRGYSGSRVASYCGCRKGVRTDAGP
jgi:hypothetical protein